MKNFLTILDADTPLSISNVGGKAAALSKLMQAGFPVPRGICLTADAFHQAITPFQAAVDNLLQRYYGNRHDLNAAEAASDQIMAALSDLSFPAELSQALFNALEMIEAEKIPVAVRSSAIHEDSAKTSFAGQYATILGVHGSAAIGDAVLDCWRSYFTVQALFERARAGKFEKGEGMAILIQPLIDAECAGVCFSIDPVAQKRDRIVINSAWGLGVGVVEGSAANDTDWLYKDKFVVEKRRIVEKKTQVKLDANGHEQIVAVSNEASCAACLPEDWLQRIAQFGVALENLFGRPQDIEWAVAGGQVWILQSRPITALPPDLETTPSFPIEWRDKDQFFAWEPSYYRGYITDPPLPLEYDQFEAIESIREEACRFMGEERNIIVKQFNGRPYSRPVRLDWSDADRRLRHQAREDWRDRLFDEGRSLWDVWGPELEKTTERLRAFDLESTDGEALAEHLEEALAAQRRHAFIHPLCIWRPRKMYFSAYTTVSGEAGPEAELAATQLLEGEDNPLTRLVDSLYNLATTARDDPSLQRLLLDCSDDILAQLPALNQDTVVTNFRQQLADLLSVYGERHGHGYGSETTVHTPTWRERPSQFLRLAVPYLDPEVESPVLSRARVRQERNLRVEGLAIACADERVVAEFRRLLANGRLWWTVLETHNHFIDQMTGGLLRHAVMAAAGWLVDHHILAEREDVFWLSFVEIFEALCAPTHPDLEPLLRRRKEQHAAWAELVPPPILGLPSALLSERPSFTVDVTPEPALDDPQLIYGQAASPGQVTGRARIVQDENSLPELRPGDILVARNVGPRWTPLFPLLGGLILDSGSVGQHAAATAREYGIVAVIATRDATKRIPDDSQVFVDGTKGTVQIQIE